MEEREKILNFVENFKNKTQSENKWETIVVEETEIKHPLQIFDNYYGKKETVKIISCEYWAELNVFLIDLKITFNNNFYFLISALMKLKAISWLRNLQIMCWILIYQV